MVLRVCIKRLDDDAIFRNIDDCSCVWPDRYRVALNTRRLTTVCKLIDAPFPRDVVLARLLSCLPATEKREK